MKDHHQYIAAVKLNCNFLMSLLWSTLEGYTFHHKIVVSSDDPWRSSPRPRELKAKISPLRRVDLLV